MSKEEHVAPTGSDGSTTDLVEPDTADVPSGDAADSAASPFGDWREQLRERVKEIRARKHSDRREDEDELGLNLAATEATAEKLEMARAQSQEVPRGQPAGAEPGEESRTQLVGRERASRRADIADVVDDLLGGPEPPTAKASAEPVEPESSEAAGETAAEPPEAPVAAPLFQEEPTVFADDPILEIVDEFENRVKNAADTDTDTDAEAEAQAQGTDSSAADGEIAPEMEADIDESPKEEEEASAAQPMNDAEPADNSLIDSIPPELRDVDIPTWALPREPSRSPQARAASGETDDEPDGNAADSFLVGDYTTPADAKRTDLGPPPDTPIPTADLLDKPIGDLLASSEEASAEAASAEAASSEEEFDEEQVEIAPPGSLVDAADFEPGDREEAPAASRSLPGLFDMADEADSEQASKPGLFFDEPTRTVLRRTGGRGRFR